jgi:predicted  nucleic acid-binding Zn-ribbon protein
LRQETANYDDEIDRYKREISFVKENFQRVNYELMEKDDQISKLSLEINSVTLRNKEQYDSKYTE